MIKEVDFSYSTKIFSFGFLTLKYPYLMKNIWTLIDQ